MKELKEIHTEAYNYLIKADVCKWSCAYSLVRCYSLMTSNIAESMNFALRHGRKLVVMTLVEFIRSLMQTWFYDQQNATGRINTVLTSTTNLQVTMNSDVAQYLIAKSVDHITYQVKDGMKDCVINLVNRICTCRRFQIDLLSCSHACAVIRCILYFIYFLGFML